MGIFFTWYDVVLTLNYKFDYKYVYYFLIKCGQNFIPIKLTSNKFGN